MKYSEHTFQILALSFDEFFSRIGKRESFLTGYYDGLKRKPFDDVHSDFVGCSLCGFYFNACVRKSLLKHVFPFLIHIPVSCD
jgi:hypothetical protein